MFILFKGDLLDEVQEVCVISNFAALFGVSPQEAAPFFKRHAVFFRNKLDSFTAQRYYRMLTGIGAKVFLGRESSVAYDSPDAAALQSIPVATCQICHTHQVFDSKCVICNGSELKKIPVQSVIGPHNHSDSGSFLSKPVPFLVELHEPELNVDDSIPAAQDALLEREEYLQAYINEAFDLLSTHEFDIDTTARIADGLYSAISNLSIWLHYQHFLYRIHDREIPLCFRQDEIEAKIRGYLNDIISRTVQLQNGIVARTHKDWTMFYAREDDPDLQEINEFRRKLLTLVYRPIVFPWDPEERDKDITERVSNALHGFDATEELFDVEFQTDTRQIWILLKPDLVEPLAGKTVCFGLWEKPGAVSWSHKKGTYRKTVTVFKRIGGDLPGKYLAPDLGNALAKAAVQIATGDFDPQK
jgi:hypothetical protein